MPIHVEWDNDTQTTIVYTYDGLLDIHEHDAVNEQTVAMLDAVDHPVDFISDIRKIRLPPFMVSQFPSVSHLAMFTHPQARHVVVVGVAGILQVFGDLFRKVYRGPGSRVLYADSVEDARAVIARANVEAQTG